MTLVLVATLFLLLALAATWIAIDSGPALILRANDASEARPDQAPLAHTLLMELAASASIRYPRLFVIPGTNANGFAISAPRELTVAITEGAFERLTSGQLRGLLAILVASVSHPRSTRDAFLASLAVALSPLALGVLVLMRWRLPAAHWHEIDQRAARLVGAGDVIATLEALEADPTPSPTIAKLMTASLYCVRPFGRTPFEMRFAMQPSLEARISRLSLAPAPGASVGPSAASRSFSQG